jgi:phospholipid/cholesterol/gamma-HCH transport system substrate-binding protein
MAIYVPSSGVVVGADGSKYTLEDSRHIGADGWKDMLAPAG